MNAARVSQMARTRTWVGQYTAARVDSREIASCGKSYLYMASVNGVWLVRAGGNHSV